MKKILFSFIACGLMIFMASCQNQDEPSVQETHSAEMDYPEGSVLTQVSINIEAEAKTRAGETNLRDWDPYTAYNGPISLPCQYGVYYPDGTLYYSSPVKAHLLMRASNLTLTIPIPAGEENMKLFFWADKSQTGTPYVIDWNNKSVTFDPKVGREECNHTYWDCGDAFYYWGDISIVGNNIITLKRPFVQIGIYTNELDQNPNLAKQFNYDRNLITIGCDFGLIESENSSTAYLPTTWYWDSDTFDMTMYNLNEEQITNYSISTYNLPSQRYSIDGVLKQNLGLFYLFAPKDKVAWKDQKTGVEFDGLIFNVYNGEGENNTCNITCTGNMPNMKQNERLVIHNSDSQGILTSGANVMVNIIDGSYE